VFDNVSKFLAERYSADFATWLLGRDIALTTLNPTELNVEAIRADSVVLLSSELWEEPVENFMGIPGFLPYAVLAQTNDREKVLERVVVEIERVSSPEEKNDLVAAAGIFAGLELSQDVIRRVIRSDVMRESVIYQEILQEGRIAGRVEGRAEGEITGLERGLQQERALIIRQLTRKLGTLQPELIERVNNLSIETIESLGEALLDFTSVADLENWL
jgi:predicted transposase YdaD